MPTRAPIACARPGCRNVQPCVEHARRPWGGQSQAQRTGAPRIPEALRHVVLERDGHACQIRDEGCTTVATTVDHVVPVARGGATHQDNLRAACSTCNHARGSREGNASRAIA